MSVDWAAPLPPGKLPNALLSLLIQQHVAPDPSVVIGPGVGRDAAVIDIGDRLLIVKTDPITFATKDAGRYVVNVNANDIACMGGTPRWILVTSLLPERSTTPTLADEMFASVAAAANQLGIAIAGGHTEITIGLDRPILVGLMIGESSPERLIDPRNARPGDAILLTGGIAIEGTAILASALGDAGTVLDPALVESAASLLEAPGISVIPAVNALNQAGVTCKCLHDPTEGGIATALRELSIATGCDVEVDADRIPILPETRVLCDAAGIDPLGLIASGALLAVVPPGDVDRALAALEVAEIVASHIGNLVEPGVGSSLVTAGVRSVLPEFPVDEIARFFAENRFPRR